MNFIDNTRGVVVASAAGLGVDQSIGLVAQAMPGFSDAFLMQAVEKGGGWVVLLIVLFFYRRDYKRLTDSEADARKDALSANNKQSDAELKLAVALTQNTEIVRQLLASQNGQQYYGEMDRRSDEDRRREAQRREEERRQDERRARP